MIDLLTLTEVVRARAVGPEVEIVAYFMPGLSGERKTVFCHIINNVIVGMTVWGKHNEL